MWEQGRYPTARLPVALELPQRRHQSTRIALRCHNLAFACERFTRALFEQRLGIECIDVAHAAVAKDGNDRLRLSRIVWGAWSHWVQPRCSRQHLCGCQRCDATTEAVQQIAPAPESLRGLMAA